MAPQQQQQQQASPAVSGGSDDARNSDRGEGGGGAAKARKIPKLPMVRHNRKWYRCRTLKSTAARVQLEFGGFESSAAPFWLPTDSDRIWRGSYKGKDWRHLVSPGSRSGLGRSVQTDLSTPEKSCDALAHACWYLK